ncbi:phage tail protein [Xenorhabdus nematophila]|uniref:phage tail protein n=1 Tax=Xenorhabdus nematophila TaxID=628 RepID=UPI0039EBAB1A
MTIRVTTAPTSVDGCIPNAQFTYGNHGKDYLPSWRRDYNTINKPTSDEVGAYSKSETDIRVNEAKDLANTRLEKSKNGADIPNKDEFVKNLGLVETKTKADNALPRSGGNVTGDITITTDTEIAWRRNTDMAAIGFKNTGDGDADSYMWFKTADNGNEYFKWQHSLSGGGISEWMSLKSDNLRVKGYPVYHEGNKPSAADVGAYTKSEINNRFIPLNTNAKTSGYILAKAANLYDDPSSRHLGRSGFLRPNGIDNLGDLAIHVAHPSTEGPEHARGISFNYGSSGDKFGLSTYTFDKDGKFQGKKKILTEDDKDSLGNVPVGVPLPWPQDKPPSGYLICNGDRFDKSRYPQLALAYPSGVLPDLRGEFIRGLDAGRNIDSVRKVLSFQEHSIQSHSHSGVFTGAFERESGGRGGWGATNTNGNTAATGGNETRPRNIAFLYIVRGA